MKKKIFILLFIILFFPITKTKAIDISYKTHVQNIGWQNYVKNDAIAGTTGKSLRVEGIHINVSDTEYSGDIEYSLHVQNIGWQKYVKNDEMAGTTGKSLRAEAIKIRLTGELAEHYSVLYSVHVKNIGWMPYVKDGAVAGTTGKALRMEGIKIKLISKDYYDVNLSYTSMNSEGWQEYVNEGTSGTTGRSLALNKIKVKLNNNSAHFIDITCYLI